MADEVNTNEMSRRSFIGKISLAAIGVGAGGALYACSPTEEPGAVSNVVSGAIETSSTDSVWDLEPVGEPIETIIADVAIVGGGGTGMCAAVQCVELGLKPLVIEQLSGYGGSFIGTEFITVIENEFQAEHDIPDSVKEAVTNHLTYHHWIPRRELAQAFLGQTKETYEWLEGHGVGFEFGAGYKERPAI
ncbi:MAG: FAD-binding protein [Coriobacteriales bacterium]|jgi:fumarate reductase flavoprotein subunit|nr:FAD-binding protein [Coriobacteriales bacterium]